MKLGLPRLGIPTASNFDLIITQEGKMGDSRSRKTYLYKLVVERITGEPVKDTFRTEWTDRGLELENEASIEFCKIMNETVQLGEFMATNDGRFGCTPDRILVDRWQAVEIKSPAPWNHVGHICAGPGNKYKPQVQGQLMIGEFDCVHFWSYCPGFVPVHIETRPDEKFQARMREYLELFWEDLEKATEYVRRKGNLDEVVSLAMEDDDESV